jgi:NTP pyrophosphatase (non-canonical NTP hydrolase)
MIILEPASGMAKYQEYIAKLEELHGWLDVDLIHNCFLMGEEVGELFKAIRRHERYFDQNDVPTDGPTKDVHQGNKAQVAEELVDVFNYLLAIANRLDIDLEDAFRQKNERNQTRSWSEAKPTH